MTAVENAADDGTLTAFLSDDETDKDERPYTGYDKYGLVDRMALETSLTRKLKFTVQKTIPRMDQPVAEMDHQVFIMGIDKDVDDGMKQAIEEAISLLVQQRRMSPTKAYRLCSLAADFNVSQVVDINKEDSRDDSQVNLRRWLPKSIHRS
jgi:acetamidase/formamidase